MSIKLSLWDFLSTLPASFAAQQLYALVLAGTVGMTGNYLVKWAKNEIEGSLWCYLFHSNIRLTILSFLSFIGLSLTSIAADIFMTADGQFIGWATVLWFGATNGYTVDSIVNKGRRQPWTDEQRTVKTQQPQR